MRSDNPLWLTLRYITIPWGGDQAAQEVSNGFQASADEPGEVPADVPEGRAREEQESSRSPDARRLATVIHDGQDVVAAICVAIAFAAGALFVMLLR